jgi:hypothetical protein
MPGRGSCEHIVPDGQECLSYVANPLTTAARVLTVLEAIC